MRGRHLLPAQFGVEPRGVGNIADQSVEPLDIVLDDRHEAPSLHRILDAPNGFDRAAQRRERVLDLMRDVGGKTFDRTHALPQRIGHVAQRARQFADLVAPPHQIGDLDPRAAAAGALGGVC